MTELQKIPGMLTQTALFIQIQAKNPGSLHK